MILRHPSTASFAFLHHFVHVRLRPLDRSRFTTRARHACTTGGMPVDGACAACSCIPLPERRLLAPLQPSQAVYDRLLSEDRRQGILFFVAAVQTKPLKEQCSLVTVTVGSTVLVLSLLLVWAGDAATCLDDGFGSEPPRPRPLASACDPLCRSVKTKLQQTLSRVNGDVSRRLMSPANQCRARFLVGWLFAESCGRSATLGTVWGVCRSAGRNVGNLHERHSPLCSLARQRTCKGCNGLSAAHRRTVFLRARGVSLIRLLRRRPHSLIGGRAQARLPGVVGGRSHENWGFTCPIESGSLIS